MQPAGPGRPFVRSPAGVPPPSCVPASGCARRRPARRSAWNPATRGHIRCTWWRGPPVFRSPSPRAIRSDAQFPRSSLE